MCMVKLTLQPSTLIPYLNQINAFQSINLIGQRLHISYYRLVKDGIISFLLHQFMFKTQQLNNYVFLHFNSRYIPVCFWIPIIHLLCPGHNFPIPNYNYLRYVMIHSQLQHPPSVVHISVPPLPQTPIHHSAYSDPVSYWTTWTALDN